MAPNVIQMCNARSWGLGLAVLGWLSSPVAFAQTASTDASSRVETFRAYMAAAETAFENQQRDMRPDFSLVREVDPALAKRKGRKSATINTKPEGAVLTLYHTQTGQALQSCLAPCQVNGFKKDKTFVTAYKRGYLPKTHWHYEQKRASPIKLSRNYASVLDADTNCRFREALRKPDQTDVYWCYKKAPSLPPSLVKTAKCSIVLDINAAGQTENIRVQSCSEGAVKNTQTDLVERTIDTVREWRALKPLASAPISSRKDIAVTMTYKLYNGQGRLIE